MPILMNQKSKIIMFEMDKMTSGKITELLYYLNYA